MKREKGHVGVAQLTRPGRVGEGLEEGGDEVCLHIALDVVNISLHLVTDQNLGWQD